MNREWRKEVEEEEWIVLQEFFHLMKDIGHDWAYAIESSDRECVTCFYKRNNVWHTYYIEKGKKFDMTHPNESLYDVCLEIMKKYKGDVGQYLTCNFEKSCGKGRQR